MKSADLVFDIDYDHLEKPILKEGRKQANKLLMILKNQLERFIMRESFDRALISKGNQK